MAPRRRAPLLMLASVPLVRGLRLARGGPLLFAALPAARGIKLAATSSPLLSAYDRLKRLLRDVSALSEVDGILTYDEQCFMPSGAAEARASQKAVLAKLRHQLSTSDDMRDAIEAVRGREEELPEPQMRANVRDAVEAYDKESRKPQDLAEQEARLESETFQAWQKAKAANDFLLFAANLSEMFKLKLEVAQVTRPACAEAYDGALDAFERGMTAERLDVIFQELRDGLVRAEHAAAHAAVAYALHAQGEPGDAWGRSIEMHGVPLLNQIMAKKAAQPNVDAPHSALVPGPQWTPAQQLELSKEVAAELGYSFTNGRLDISSHPFTGGAGPTDVRITTRFSENWAEGFGATIHETGHSLYEQGRDLSEEGRGLPSSSALSMGVHESQSLLWERMVLQSREFWDYATPKFHERFPFTKEATADDFYATYNRVSPGFIRVEADEVTYPLHVILRYDIERALFRGDMEVEEVPEYWRFRMKSDLGIDVSTDNEGCLQDIHWAFGAIGYFPSYTLGAIIAAQLFDAALADIGTHTLRSQISRGEFGPLREWLREKVHKVGSVHPSPDDLLQSICGQGVSPQPMLRYLREKYGALYGL